MPLSSRVRSGHFAAILMLLVGFVIAFVGMGIVVQAPSANAAAPPIKVGQAQQPNNPAGTNLVISQIYGGGGNTGGVYTNDFIELFNPTNITITMTNWSVQYASAAGTTWNNLTVINGSIGPGKYFLIQEAAGATTIAPLPTPDASGTIAMSATNGKVALVNTSAQLPACGTKATDTCTDEPQVVDFVGYGTASDYEGTAAAPAMTNSTADLRDLNGCEDTDDNAANFTAGAPAPRNSSSPANPCVVNTPTVTNTATETQTPTETGTATETVTGTPPTATDTAVPTDTSTATQTNTATQTATASATVTALAIHTIQGASHTSPMVGQTVSNVFGIVTAKLSNGYYMQDPNPDANDSTSEAIFVFTSSAPNSVNIGDSVRVSGTVTEFRPGGSGSTNLTTTEISSPTTVVLSSGNSLPAPVVIGIGGRIPPTTVIEDDASGSVETSGVFDPAQDGIDFYESLEAMRVQVNKPVAVGPSNSFGEIPVLADNGANAGLRTARGGIIVQPNDFNPERIILDDTIIATPSGVDVGDEFDTSAVGVMDYGFGNFKLYITQPLAVISGNLPKETAVAATTGQIAIGNFNVENLAPTSAEPSEDPQSKYDALAGLIVNNMKAPDLLSIEEIQDNNGDTNNGVVAADQTWNQLITTISTTYSIPYTYTQIDPANNQDGGEPGGNIRQGFLYRTDRGLTFVSKPGANATTACTIQPGPTLNFSPCRIDPTNTAFSNSRKPLVGEFMYNGQTIFMIGNHLNSKGGDDPLFGRFQPPVRSSEVQRHEQAAVIYNFVKSLVAADTNANVLVTGDINDFEFSDTTDILETGEADRSGSQVLTSLIKLLPANERYTYVFDGNSQTLDQTLVSDHMLGFKVGEVDVVHVNSEYDPQDSDHEPQVTRFSPVGANTATPTQTQTSTTVPSSTSTSTETTTATSTATTVPASTSTGTSTATTVPSGTSTGTATKTATTVPASTGTATPNATATACAIKFADVPPVGEGSTFYGFVRCLACRHIVSGYPCGGPGEPCNDDNDPYYRPGANVTRGQLSKIIANSAGLSDTPGEGQQQFADVVPGDPFYIYVERLAQTGAISGYPCATADEGCDAQNRPLFRPNNPATRGQISKIVSIAAGFEEDVPEDQQTFTDVPTDSPFWVYIERLAGRGIISGYGDPDKCPTGTPCFHYNEHTTRGQMAKIAANAFFPDCETPARGR